MFFFIIIIIIIEFRLLIKVDYGSMLIVVVNRRSPFDGCRFCTLINCLVSLRCCASITHSTHSSNRVSNVPTTPLQSPQVVAYSTHSKLPVKHLIALLYISCSTNSCRCSTSTLPLVDESHAHSLNP